MPDRRPSTAKPLVYLVIMIAIFALLQSLHEQAGDATDEAVDAVDAVEVEIAVPAVIEEDVSAARRLLHSDPDAALVHIQRALARADGAAPELRASLHTWAADVHVRRWHLHRARAALQSAIAIAPTDTRRHFLANVEESIKRAQGERGKAQFYFATPDAGPAAELRGRVVVVYLLVDPGGPERWTDVERIYARNTLARVERWYGAMAVARGVAAPEFTERVFQVPLAAGDLPLFPNVDVAHRTAWLLAKNLGYDSVGEFLAALVADERADQAMLLVHSPQDARSFATPCTRERYCEAEIAFIYAPNGASSWDHLAYTLAHEGLHLFGADDLYNVRGAEDYDPTDLMHYASTRLEYADIGDLTAWAVGWAPDRPKTPFHVEE